MSIILKNLTSPTIEEAIEANFNEEMAHLGYGLPQGELHKTPELLWIYTGSLGPNAVLYSRFASDETSYIDARIDEMQAFFKTRNMDFSWTTGPSTRPTDLALISRHMVLCIVTLQQEWQLICRHSTNISL